MSGSARHNRGQPHLDLVCDASGFGLGAVLIKQGRLIPFWCRNVVSAKHNCCITQQELLALLEALTALQCYVDGKPFN